MADRQGKAGDVSAVRSAADEQEIDLIDYLLVIWRHRWMIALLTVAAMGVTVALMLLQPRRYESRATIVPPVEILQKEAGAAGGLGALGNSVLRNIIDTGSIAGIYVEILESREVADALIERFDLMHVYEDLEFQSEARRQLARHTKIETTDEGAVKIAVTDLDPNRAAAMANAYLEELDQRNKKLMTGQATSKRVFLENRLKEVEAKLSRIDALPAHEAQVQQMLYDWLIRECELAKIEEARSMPTIQVLDEAVVPEQPVPRGTIKKGILAGMAALMFGIFLAFTREYVASARVRRQEPARLPASAERSDTGAHTFPRGDDDIRRAASAPQPVGSGPRQA
ncbi:MAG: hypothetical protein JW993_03405 [Sedimentisphaerales bacterium]|nr:hypothetical protein [Sedimentisphaerales bacterium]